MLSALQESMVLRVRTARKEMQSLPAFDYGEASWLVER